MPVAIHQRDLALRTPLTTGGHTLDRRRVWVVAIDHGNHRGLGEAAPLPGFGGEPPEHCAGTLARAQTLLTPAYLSAFLAGVRTLGDDLENLLVAAPCARHAIEGALLDLLAQHLDLPLAVVLGAGARSLAVNALIGGEGDDAHAAERACAAEDVGFATIKLKLPADADRAMARVIAVSRALGKGTLLRVDANAAWTLATAERFARSVFDVPIEYCEQPLPADDIRDAATLRATTNLRLAADESIRTADDIDRVAAAGAADVVILKPMFLGGWAPLVDAVRHADRKGLDVVITSALDGAIGRAAATHYTCALDLIGVAHGLSTGGLFARDLTSEPLGITTGRVSLRDLPGLGVGDLID
jgi:o-succinylbenzoate synthase